MQKLHLISLSLCLLSSACATISGSGTSQSVSIQTLAADGEELPGANCELTNDEGKWFLTSPGSATVHRSNKDLQVLCKKKGIDIGSAAVVSRIKGNMFGNILFGGGIGAVIDHNNGSAYEYPAFLQVIMGKQNQRIEGAKAEASAADSMSPGARSIQGDNKALN